MSGPSAKKRVSHSRATRPNTAADRSLFVDTSPETLTQDVTIWRACGYELSDADELLEQASTGQPECAISTRQRGMKLVALSRAQDGDRRFESDHRTS